MSFAQIEKLWTDNGGNAASAPIMAAIAEAESGGNPTSLNNNPSTGDYSVGLWQINYFGSMLGPRSKSYGTPQALQGNANAQAKAAISISNNGTSLSPWSTYTSGAYKQYLNGNPAATLLGTGTATTTGSNSCTPVISLGPVGTVLDSCQAAEIVGGFLMAVGAVAVVVGLGVILADLGLRKSAPAILGAVVGDRAGKRSAQRQSAAREQASGLRVQETEAKASARRSTASSSRSLPGAADKERWGREGFPGD